MISVPAYLPEHNGAYPGSATSACIPVPFPMPYNGATVSQPERVCVARSCESAPACFLNVADYQCLTTTGTLHCKNAGKIEFCLIIMEVENEYIGGIAYVVDAVCSTIAQCVF